MKQKQWDEWITKGELPEGTKYWTVHFYGGALACGFDWIGHAFDNRLLSRGLVFRTRTQAQVCAKRMLAAAKEI